MKSMKSKTGFFQNESWREASDGGYISYVMRTNMENNLSLLVRYTDVKARESQFEILIDGEKLGSENLAAKLNKTGFVILEYLIPDSMIVGKKSVEVRFQTLQGNTTGGVSYIRMLHKTSLH